MKFKALAVVATFFIGMIGFSSPASSVDFGIKDCYTGSNKTVCVLQDGNFICQDIGDSYVGPC